MTPDVSILSYPTGRVVVIGDADSEFIRLEPEEAELVLFKLHSVVQNLRGVERPPARSLRDRIRLIRSALASR